MYKLTENSRFLSCDEEHSFNDPRMYQAFYPTDEFDKRCIVMEAKLPFDEICDLVKPLVEIDATLVDPDEYYIDILELEREGIVGGTVYIIIGTEEAMNRLWGHQNLGVESKVTIIRTHSKDGALNPMYILDDVLAY